MSVLAEAAGRLGRIQPSAGEKWRHLAVPPSLGRKSHAALNCTPLVQSCTDTICKMQRRARTIFPCPWRSQKLRRDWRLAKVGRLRWDPGCLRQGLPGLTIRTPGPPPFSSMNTTPAASSTRRIASTVRGRKASPRSSRATVSVDTPAAAASSRTPKPVAARAILALPVGRIGKFATRRREIDGCWHNLGRVCDGHGIERWLTKVNHPWINGQVERTDHMVKDAAVKRCRAEGLIGG